MIWILYAGRKNTFENFFEGEHREIIALIKLNRPQFKLTAKLRLKINLIETSKVSNTFFFLVINSYRKSYERKWPLGLCRFHTAEESREFLIKTTIQYNGFPLSVTTITPPIICV